MDAFEEIRSGVSSNAGAPNGSVMVGKDLFVHLSEPKRFKEGLGMQRKGFQKQQFDKQYFVTVTLFDHSQGHGQVKSVILRNPAPEYLVKVRDAAMWDVKKIAIVVVAVTEEGEVVEAERTFRVVTLRTSSGEVTMSNTVEQQIANLREGSKRGDFKINGEVVEIIGYQNAKGETIQLNKDEEPEVAEPAKPADA